MTIVRLGMMLFHFPYVRLDRLQYAVVETSRALGADFITLQLHTQDGTGRLRVRMKHQTTEA